MKRLIFTLILILFLMSFISAEDSVTIIINEQPSGVYNLGDSFSIPLTIKSLTEITGNLEMDLICGGKSTNFYKNGVKLSAGAEQRMNPVLVLTKNNIGFTKGTCKIKTKFGEQYVLTEDFTISDVLTITLKSGEGEFDPDDEIIIQGEVTKENGDLVNGFIEIELSSGNDSQNSYLETVNNGFFSVDLNLPSDTPAGPYLISLNTYEKDLNGETTNSGVLDYLLTIKQVPTSLEVLAENSEVKPGTTLKVKAILHDQSGLNVGGTKAIITLKDSDDKIITQSERATDEFLEFEIPYNQPPENWTIFAVSTQLDGKTTIIIQENKEIKYELANKTLIITNVGNVFYNDTAFIKIGEEVREIELSLDVDESKKYTLSAPEGQYDIEVITEDGGELIGSVGLTGKSISINEAKSVIGQIFNPFIWVFIIAICGFVAFMFFKKGYRRSFIGYIKSKKDSLKNFKKKETPNRVERLNTLDKRSKAILSLSIKGDKQDSTILSLKIKNLKEIESGSKEILNKIIDLAEEDKAILYKEGDYLIFIFAPVITKTFQNEKPAIILSKKIVNYLTNYNRLAQNKIEFGIALNHGTIVAKKEGENLKFMSMKTLIPKAKKISTISDQEVLLTDEINDRLLTLGGVRTEKQMKHNIKFYKIKEMRDTSGDKTFLSNFVRRLEGEKKD